MARIFKSRGDQWERDPAGYSERQQRHPEHDVSLHGDGVAEAHPGFVKHENGDGAEAQRIGEGRENSRAVVAVGMFARRRPLCPSRGEPGDNQRGDVGQIVNRIAHEGDGMTDIARGEFHDHESERGHHGHAENARQMSGGKVRMGVVVRMRM